MDLNDLIVVLREDFAAEMPAMQGHLIGWQAQPASGPEHAKAIWEFMERTRSATELVAMHGVVQWLEVLKNYVKANARRGTDVERLNLEWLEPWGDGILAYMDAPGDADVVERIAAHARRCPLAISDEALNTLIEALLVKPTLAADSDMLPAAIEPATADDVSLTATDLDADLFGAFLADAPTQVEKLEQFTERLVAWQLDASEIVEAQRIAHTFKGSGNIIGLPGIGRVAHRVEDLIEHAAEYLREGAKPNTAMLRDTQRGVTCLAQMVAHLQGEEAAPGDALDVLNRLLDWVRAIQNGEAEDFNPPELAQAAVGETRATEGAGPAVMGAAGADALRVGADRLSRMMRRAGQALIHSERFSQMVNASVQRLQQLELSHANLARHLRDLELTVERQRVVIEEHQAVSGQMDSLEMDRYDALHLLTRQITELAADELEMAKDSRVQSESALRTLREHNLGLKDQHRELIESRLVPVKSIGARLKRNVAQTAAATGKRARLEIVGDQVTMDADVLQRLTEPLLHLLRNAVDHGVESPEHRKAVGKAEEGVVRLSFERLGQEVRLVCADDGGGLNLMAIFEKAVAFGLVERHAELSDAQISQLIFRAGFSTRDTVTETSGRGVGLDVVAERIGALKGRVEVRSEPGRGSRFIIYVPVSFGSVQSMVVRCEGELIAVPADQIVVGLAAQQGAVVFDGGPMLEFNERRYPLVRLAAWLGFDDAPVDVAVLHQAPKLLVRGATGDLALAVDEIVQSRELIIQDAGALIGRIRGVVAASLRADGKPMFVLNVAALEQSRAQPARSVTAAMRERMAAKRTSVLVVDDALSVRKSMEQLITDAGFDVVTANDGLQALERLRERKPSMVLTDLEMPNLNGLELTRRIREVPDWVDVPIVMITSRATDKHRNLALDSGVDIFLTKPYTDTELLQHVRMLAGSASASVLMQT